MRRRAGVLGSLLIAVATVAAGCSDDDDVATAPTASPSTAPTPTSPSTATATATAVQPSSSAPAITTAPSSGCGNPHDAAPGETSVDIRAAGRAGRYIEQLPVGYDGSTPGPLILDLHGYSEPIEFHTQVSNLNVAGGAAGFIVVTPTVTREIPRWNTAPGSGDMQFLVTLLDRLQARRCVDTARVFVTGFSNGAMMSSALACEHADRLAAIAPVAGVQDPPGCHPQRPVPVLAFHGTEDQFLTFDGGLGTAASALPTPGGGTIGTIAAGGGQPSVPEVMASWADRNGCTGDDADEIGDDVVRVAHDCPPGADVELYRVDGGGHAWPGSDASASIESVVGPTTFTIDATALMLAFFDGVSSAP